MTPDFTKENGLIPAIVQDSETLQVLMLGYMSEESFRLTLETGKVTFFSRSRQQLWVKGETSGHFLHLVSHHIDCDNDTILIFAKPDGPTCHRGTTSCFTDGTEPTSAILFLNKLQNLLETRKRDMPEGSYTSKLFAKGLDKITQKVGEEAIETVIASKNNNEELLYEASDLLFHLMVLLTERGMRIEDLAEELQKRHK